LPLSIWALYELRVYPLFFSCWFVVLALAVSNLVFSGQLQIATYSLVLMLGFIGYSALCRTSRKTEYFIVSLGALIAGLALSSIQLVPTWELSQLSVRAHLSFAEFTGGSFPLGQSLAFLFPFIFGGSPHSLYGRPYHGSWNFANFVCYVGLLPLMLASSGLLVSIDADTDTYFWFGAAIVAFMLALGKGTALAVPLFHLFPYNLFRVPARHFVECSFALSVLAGGGVVAVARHCVSQRLLSMVVAAVGAVLLVTAVLELGHGVYALRPDGVRHVISQRVVYRWADPALIIPAFIFTISASSLLLWQRSTGSRALQGFVILALILDLGSFAWFCQWRFDAAHKTLWTKPPASALRYGSLLDQSMQRMVAVQGAFAANSTLPPNLSQLWRVPSASGYGPLAPAEISQLLGITRANGISSANVGGDWWSMTNQTLDVLAVRYAFIPESVWKSIAPAVARSSPLRWRLTEHVGHTAIVENLRAVPRAWLVAQAVEAGPREILRAIQTSQLVNARPFDARQLALLDESAPALHSYRVDCSSSHVSIEKIASTEVVLRVGIVGFGSCFLILSDSYYPGWRATVDAKPTHIYRTDYVLRGVAVPTGTHVVRFTFVPIAFTIGAWISQVTLLALVSICVIIALRQKLEMSQRS